MECFLVSLIGGIGTKKITQVAIYRPWKINMEPENDGLEDDFPFQLGDR